MEKIDKILARKNVFKTFVMWPSNTMYRLYHWTLKWGRTKYATFSLFILAFAESSFFPIPPDVLLIAVTVSNRGKWWFYATVATIGSVLGAILGYYIGYAVYGTVGEPIVQFYHLDKHFETVRAAYENNAFLALFTAAFTPIPFKVFTVAGGLFQISLTDLILGSILGRAGRFFAVAFALRIFGKKVEDTIEKYFNILSIAFIILLVGGFLILRLL